MNNEPKSNVCDHKWAEITECQGRQQKWVCVLCGILKLGEMRVCIVESDYRLSHSEQRQLNEIATRNQPALDALMRGESVGINAVEVSFEHGIGPMIDEMYGKLGFSEG